MRYLNCSGLYTLPRNLNNVSFPKYATDKELLDWYNKYSDSTSTLKKFTNREIAERKCLELKQAMDWLTMSAQTTKKENKTVMNKKAKTTNAKAAKAKKAAAKSKSNGSRKFALLDHTLHKIAKDNPRREGTHGFKTWDVIKNGMTYRDAIDAGARNKDIRHDINLKRLELRAPKGGAKAPEPKAEKPAKAPKAKGKKAAKQVVTKAPLSATVTTEVTS